MGNKKARELAKNREREQQWERARNERRAATTDISAFGAGARRIQTDRHAPAKRLISLILALLGTWGCSSVQEGDSLGRIYEGLAQCMGDATLPQEKRLRAARMLDQADKDVIPVLIRHLRDRRAYNPSYKEISETADAGKEIPTRVLTVGEHCESLLRKKVFGTVRIPMKAAIPNWDDWWAKNNHKSLAEIQERGKQALAEASEPRK